MFKKIIVWCLWILGLATSIPALASTVWFEITVEPNPIKVSEFADVTIKAIDDNGNVDTWATDIDIWIEVEWFEYTDPDVVIPWWGIWFFEASDQWVKIFSKWLTVKKPWTYKLTVVDVYDDNIKWEAELQVLADSSWPAQWTLSVVTPEKNSILTSDVLNILWATSFPNTPLVVLIDWIEVQEWLSDQKWDFTLIATWLEPWLHTLEVNALDLDSQIVASSWPIPFDYQADDWDLLLDVEVTPSAVIQIREEVTFVIKTAERVTAALIAVGEWATMVPTTMTSPWVFEKQMTFDTPWTYPVDVTLQVWATPTVFEDVEALVVKDEVRKIITLDHTDDIEKSRSDLVWTYEWKIDYFKVRYGTNKNNLRLSLTTSKAEWTLILADPTKEYYAQVFPVDENWIINGEPSDIIKIWPLEEAAPICGNGIVEWGEECDDWNIVSNDWCNALCTIEAPKPVCGNWRIEEWEECDDWNILNNDWCNAICKVQAVQICGNWVVETWESCDDWNILNNDGCTSTCTIEEKQAPAGPQTCYTDWITLTTKKVNDKYYITWADVPLAREYIVYRADQAVWALSQMRVIARTNETMFEYPFDPNAEADKWAWYAVEAVCEETQEQKQVWDMTKVKVWPEHTIVFMILLSIIWFWWARIIRGLRG